MKSDFDSSILPIVARPNRYAGQHSTADPARFEKARLLALVAHPDLFEAGLGDASTRAAWRALNAAPGTAADLVLSPWPDCAAELDRQGAVPWGLESGRPLPAFQLVVLVPTGALEAINILALLDRARLPHRALDRDAAAPLIVLAGPVAAQPGALTDVVDLSLPGDPAATLGDLAERLAPLSGAPLAERRAAARTVPGAWWPERSDTVRAGALRHGEVPFEEPFVVPMAEVDREGLLLDIRRGGLGRRFEWGAGAFRDPWNLGVDDAVAACERGLLAGGYDRVEFVGDDPVAHPDLLRMTEALVRRFPAVRFHLSDYGAKEPGPALARELLRGKRAGFVWSVPAAGERLGRVLNAPFDEALFLGAVATAVRGGASQLKIRFGLGWPTETDDDLASLIALVQRVRSVAHSGSSSARIVVSLEPFVPRAHTPFEWEAMPGAAEFERRIVWLSRELESGPVQVRAKPTGPALIEGVLARAGREALDWVAAARAAGATTPTPMSPWNGAPWLSAFRAHGVDPEAGVPARDEAAARSWGGIVSGLPLEVLRSERRRALLAETTPAEELAVAAAEAFDARAPIRVAPAADIDPAVSGSPEDPAGYGRRGRRRLAAASRPAARYRLRFAREEPLRFTSHLDLGRAVERGLRRLAQGSLAWRGRSVKLSFGPPLPLGWTGADEYLDLHFADEVAETLPQGLAPVFPPGLVFLDVKPIRASVESLAQAIDRTRVELRFPPAYLRAAGGLSVDDLRTRLEAGVHRLLSASTWPIPKSAGDEMNRIDIRPGVLDARVGTDADGGPLLWLHLTLGQPGSVRPDVLLPYLLATSASPTTAGEGADPRLARVHRTELRIAGNGREFSPLEVVELDFPWWRESSRRSAAGGRGSHPGP